MLGAAPQNSGLALIDRHPGILCIITMLLSGAQSMLLLSNRPGIKCYPGHLHKTWILFCQDTGHCIGEKSGDLLVLQVS